MKNCRTISILWVVGAFAWQMLGIVLWYQLIVKFALRQVEPNLWLTLWAIIIAVWIVSTVSLPLGESVKKICQASQKRGSRGIALVKSFIRAYDWSIATALKLLIQGGFLFISVRLVKQIFAIETPFSAVEWSAIVLFSSWLISPLREYLEELSDKRQSLTHLLARLAQVRTDLGR